MTHYFILKVSKNNIEKFYEFWGDLDTALAFLNVFNEKYKEFLTLVEVIN